MKGIGITIGVIGLVMSVASLSHAAAPAKDGKWKTQYRGFTVCRMDDATLASAAKNWNANQVRYMMCPVWWKDQWKMPSYQETWKKILADLPAGLDRAKALGLAVVLDLHQIPNDNPKKYSDDGAKASHESWYDESNLKVLIECWKQVAEICKNRDEVIWFDLLNEPLDWTVVHSHPSYPPTWPEWAQKTTDAIRTIDKKHPIVVEPGPGMLTWGFAGFTPVKDPVMPVIYSVHPYQPVEYTHQGVSNKIPRSFPGPFNEHGGGMWDKKRLREEIKDAIEFQRKNGIQIYVGEFSVARWAPNGARYLRELIELFEEMGWDWNYHSWQEADVWSLEESSEVDLYDKAGKYVKTAVPDPNEGLFYAQYGTPGVGKPKKPEGLTDRAQVLKHYLDRNITTFKKVLIIGNSITHHGPSAMLDWPNDCGMAATGVDKDFAHLLFKKICDAQPKAKPQLRLDRVTNEAAMKGFEHLLPCDADLIIIELGDNYRGKADEAELQKPYEQMIAALRKDHPCRVFCLSAWGNTALNPWIQKAAANQGATYVDISHLFGDVKNRAGSEGHFKHDGVNWHPGDRGMAAIARTIYKAIREK